MAVGRTSRWSLGVPVAAVCAVVGALAAVPARVAAVAPPPAPGAASLAEATGMTVAEAEIALDLAARINRERAALGIAPVRFDVRIAATSLAWSRGMPSGGYRHDPAYPDAIRRAVRAPLRVAAENIHHPTAGNELACFGAPDRPQSACVHGDFMRSPRHRANILSPLVTRVGIGVSCAAGGETMWVTQRFATLRREATSGEIAALAAIAVPDASAAPAIATEPSGLRCPA
jgi:uncharacterized protein YkwD